MAHVEMRLPRRRARNGSDIDSLEFTIQFLFNMLLLFMLNLWIGRGRRGGDSLPIKQHRDAIALL